MYHNYPNQFGCSFSVAIGRGWLCDARTVFRGAIELAHWGTCTLVDGVFISSTPQSLTGCPWKKLCYLSPVKRACALDTGQTTVRPCIHRCHPRTESRASSIHSSPLSSRPCHLSPQARSLILDSKEYDSCDQPLGSEYRPRRCVSIVIRRGHDGACA